VRPSVCMLSCVKSCCWDRCPKLLVFELDTSVVSFLMTAEHLSRLIYLVSSREISSLQLLFDCEGCRKSLQKNAHCSLLQWGLQIAVAVTPFHASELRQGRKKELT